MKKPNSRRNLDEAIRRVAGLDAGYVKAKTIIANAIVCQMLHEGVVKGGSALKLRFGDPSTRFTTDLDVARKADLESFAGELERRLEMGWNGFTGRLVKRSPAHPVGVPVGYVMQPYEVKLSYMGKSWLTVPLEIGHDEIGDADEAEMGLAQDVAQLFDAIGLPAPESVPLMPLHFQIAQKLHGLTEERSERAHDLIDLQILVREGAVDFAKTRVTCERLFAYRRAQDWPSPVAKNDG